MIRCWLHKKMSAFYWRYWIQMLEALREQLNEEMRQREELLRNLEAKDSENMMIHAEMKRIRVVSDDFILPFSLGFKLRHYMKQKSPASRNLLLFKNYVVDILPACMSIFRLVDRYISISASASSIRTKCVWGDSGLFRPWLQESFFYNLAPSFHVCMNFCRRWNLWAPVPFRKRPEVFRKNFSAMNQTDFSAS